MARDPWPLVHAVPPPRDPAETLAAEILPLADAARFLERTAARLLAPRRPIGVRPLWLWGVRAQVRREPIGVVLILAPSNYPLMLPGVQTLQALAAGNSVCIKPAPGCAGATTALALMLMEAGLPRGVLTVLDETPEAGTAAVAGGPDLVVLTGSAETGRRVLAAAAQRVVPAIMELSGCDAIFVLEGADLSLVADCVAYGLRLNGGATCIAPRRIFVQQAQAEALEAAILVRLQDDPSVTVPSHTAALLAGVLSEAEADGARVLGRRNGTALGPLLVAGATARMRVTREDLFAPVAALIVVDGIEAALAEATACPYALGASVFGPPVTAFAVAAQVQAGSVVVNDIVVPTADPRLPFGGRGASGFGVTRGAEGLLGMTSTKVISVRYGRFRPHLRPPHAGDAARMAALLTLTHAGHLPRWNTLRDLLGG
jgi:acyl-CoA reductase-like NAD-dependent aldehyde dehydrogenase